MRSDVDVKKLKLMAAKMRGNIVEMIPPGKVGHLGGSSSICDILSVLYFHRMKNLDPKNPKKKNRDRLLLSKGTPYSPNMPRSLSSDISGARSSKK